MTHKQWRTTIALLVAFVLSVFCIAPFKMYYGEMTSLLIYACDHGEEFLLCPILAVALLAVQYLNEKLRIREVLTYVFLGGAVSAFVGAVLRVYEGRPFDEILFETGGGVLLLSVGFAGLAAAVFLRKSSCRNVSRGATAFLALTAMLSFLCVPFIRLGYGATGVKIIRIMDHLLDGNIPWPYGFVFFPLLVAGLQSVRDARVRFYATFALWIPFLLYFGSETEDDFWGFADLTFEASLYACIAVLTSVAAYCSMRFEAADRADRADHADHADRADRADRAEGASEEATAAVDAMRADWIPSATVLVTAAIMMLSCLNWDGMWVRILFAAVLIGCLIANRNRLRIVSLVGLGLSAFSWLSFVGIQIGWDRVNVTNDNELVQLLSVLTYCLLGVHYAAPLLYIWATDRSRRVKILYSLLPVFMLAGVFVAKIIWAQVFGAEAEADQFAIESRIETARSYIAVCNYVLFAFGAAVCGLLWWTLRGEWKK